MLKAIIAAILFLVVALGGAWGSFVSLRNYCADEYESDIQVKSAGNQERPQQQPRAPIFSVSENTLLNSGYAQRSSNSTDRETEWARKYICELKAGELALAWFTLLLVFVTAALVFLGFRQEWWMRKHERPYMLAGPGKREFVWDENGVLQGMRLRLQFTNYGRTPAFVKRTYWHVRPLKGLPKIPHYSDPSAGGMAVNPGQTFHSRMHRDYRFDWTERHVSYGLIVYDDAFGKEHSAGFLDLIVRRDEGFMHPTLGKERFKKYWEYT